MRLASKQQLRREIFECQEWIAANPGKFDGVLSMYAKIKQLESYLPDAPEEGEIQHA